MSSNLTTDRRDGRRYVIALPVRAEWDEDETGEHAVVEGATENVGPDGALVHLRQLPRVGSRVRFAVLDEGKPRIETVAEVLRVERNPGHPLAALQLISALDEWRGLVWEPSAIESQKGDDYEYED